MPAHAFQSEAGGGGSKHTIQDEGTARTARTGLNFTGAGVSATDDAANDRTNVTIAGGGTGHTIQDEGTARTARTGLNFIGANVSATDDSGNDRTNVTITGEAAGAVAAHEADTTGVHGIANTANVVQAAIHNGTSYPSRPSGAASVQWIGPTDPGGAAQNNDTWIPTA